MLGRGKRLFGDGAILTVLALVDTKTSTTGVTIATYRLSRAVVPGSFAARALPRCASPRCRRSGGGA